MSEGAFIARLKEMASSHERVKVGIGDDGAVLVTSQETVVATDMLLDGVHFRCEDMAGEAIGRKSLAVNLSDLAAMASIPEAAFLSLAVPKSLPPRFLEGFMTGFLELAERYQVALAGGDTNSWGGAFCVNVTVTGRVSERGVITRGALGGDLLYVSGPLGGSFESNHHLYFEPRVDLALKLHHSLPLRGMMDLSDGLGIDLERFLKPGQGVQIFGEQLPIRSNLQHLPIEEQIARAFGDGEDFELLFALPKEVDLAIAGIKAYLIGEVTDSESRELFLGQKRIPYPKGGFEHSWGDK